MTPVSGAHAGRPKGATTRRGLSPQRFYTVESRPRAALEGWGGEGWILLPGAAKTPHHGHTATELGDAQGNDMPNNDPGWCVSHSAGSFLRAVVESADKDGNRKGHNSQPS